MATKQGIRRKLEKKIEKVSGYQNVITGRLGTSANSSVSQIETGIPGLVYVRVEGSGQIIKAINSGGAPSENNHPVLLAKSKVKSGLLEIIGSRQSYSVPVNGNLRYHHSQHEHPNPDTVWVRADQFLPFLVSPDSSQGSFYVKIYGGVINLSGARYKINNQSLNLASLVPTTDSNAKWVLIQITSAGAVGTVSGTEVNSKELLDPADIPLPSAGAMELCAVRMYAGQTQLRRDTINDFVDLRFGRQVGGGSVTALDDLSDVNVPSPTDGQVLTWDSYAEEWIALDPIGGTPTYTTISANDPATDVTGAELEELTDGSVTLLHSHGDGPSWINVVAYGAVGDGATDDSAAIGDAVTALNAAGGGVLYFPAGEYLVTSGFTITANATILGDGPGLYLSSSLDYPLSRILCDSTTATVFSITADTGMVKDIALVNIAATPPTAGAGIHVSSANVNQRVNYQNIQVHGFYVNVDVQVGTAWSMINCVITAPVLYGLKVRNTINGDSGDWSVVGCWFSGFVHNSTAGIRVESSGGAKILNCKINGASSTQAFQDGIDLTSVTGITGNFQVANCSIENVRRHGIKMSGSSWHDVLIYGCQFGLSWNTSNNTGNAINIDNHDYVVIANCTLRGGTTPVAIALANLAHARLIGNINISFSAMYSETSCTDVIELSGGGVTSFAKSGETALIGAVTLSEGANITLTQVGNDIEIASTASSSGGYAEIVMEDGVTFPPVPITTEDGDDWIYDA